MNKINCIFFWTPGLSANILKYLHTQESLNIVAVVTTPDQPAGRGHELMMSPVGKYAKDNNLPLLQPEKVRSNETFFGAIKELKPDICLVVAYGKILPQELLDIPPMGFLNVHTSLLPKYRWAAPIQHALMHGEKVTGLTVQQMSLGMDEWDVLVQESWEVSSSDTTGTLFEKTSERAGPLLIEAITGLQDKILTPKPQNAEDATYTKMIEKKDGEIQTTWTIDEAYHRWQAYTPWPGLYTFFNWTKVTFLEIEKRAKIKEQKDGIFFIVDNLPAIELSDGILIIKKIHPAGKKPMSGEDFVRGFMKS